MPNQFYIIVVSEIFLGLYALLGHSPDLQAAAVGAMIGLAGGHLNGSQKQVPQ